MRALLRHRGAATRSAVRLIASAAPRQRLRPSDPLAAALFDEAADEVSLSAAESTVGPVMAMSHLLSRRADHGWSGEALDAVLRSMDERTRARIADQHAALAVVPTAELTARVQHYLSATTRVRLVSAEEEHMLFPVVNQRLEELTVDQMLDIVSCHWPRSTLARYGTALKDRIRDRIALIAAHAGQQLQHKTGGAASLDEETEPEVQPTEEVHDDTTVNDQDHPPLQSGSAESDPILAQAVSTMDAPTVLRCLVVMGLSAGHRKRDVAFFQVIGSFVVFHVNRYQSSDDLVRAVTALSRAKIVPPESFLSLIARRLPVLHKRSPLSPLSAYRVMVNLSRMGYKPMNVYRFLADVMLHTMQDSLATAAAAPSSSSPSGPIEPLKKGDLERLTGLKPSMFTKWLAVLGLTGAPHQQYLRPLVFPLLVPSLATLPPPSFSRLLTAICRFHSTDVELLEPVLAHVTTQLAPAGHLRRADALTLLRLLATLSDETPPPSNAAAFFTVVRSTFGASDADPTAASSPMRPRDMCVVAHCVARYQTRTSLPLEALSPLLRLLDDFAAILCVWVELGVVSLVHVDQYVSLCVHQVQLPDAGGHLARLQALQQRLDPMDVTGSVEPVDVREYAAKLDIDVRDVFEGLTLVNDPAAAYGGYKPIPGPLLVDFRELLARCSALDVLEAVDLFDRSCPGALSTGAKLVLTRSVLAKLTYAGEEVLAEDGRELRLRPAQPLVLTREDVTRLARLLRRCPLDKVRGSEAVWEAVQRKASQLGMSAAALDEAQPGGEQRHV